MFDRELFLAKRSKASKLTVKVDGYTVTLDGRPKSANDAGIVKLAESQPDIDEKGKGGVRVTHKYDTETGKECTQRDTLTPKDGGTFLRGEEPAKPSKAEERAAASAAAAVNGTPS